MTTTKRPTYVLGLSIPDPAHLFQNRTGLNRGDAEINLYPVTIGPAPGDYGERVASTEVRGLRESDRINGLYLASFRIHAYVKTTDAGTREVWGWNIWAQPFTMDSADDAERIARTFKTIEARMRRLRERDGYPADFVGYVTHVCQAMGLTRVALGRSYAEARIETLGRGIDALRHYLQQAQATAAEVA